MEVTKTAVNELRNFRSKLYPFLALAAALSKPGAPSEDPLEYNRRWAVLSDKFYTTRVELLETYGRLASWIEARGGGPPVVRMGRGESKREVEAVALAFGVSCRSDLELMRVAIGKIHDRTTFVIGTLSAEACADSAAGELAVSPRAFIAQGGASSALSKLTKFLSAMGVEAVVAQDKPSEGRSVGRHVERYLDQCDCAIILATKGDIDGRTGERLPRGNVSHEIGKCEVRFPGRVIYLKENGVVFPSNIRERVWESFSANHMDKAFIKVAGELRAFGLLRSAKAPQ